MSNLNKVLGLCTCCLCLMVGNTALADYTGLVHVTKADDDTVNLCNNANGNSVPEPLDVCNVLAGFDNPVDRFLAVGDADITASNGVYFQHPFNFGATSPDCALITPFPDLICDSFVTIGYKCVPADAEDGTATDADFNADEFAFNGHVVGGWFNSAPYNGQGDAGNDPPNQNLHVLFLQLSVPTGESITGAINVFALINGEVLAFVDQAVECFVVDGCVPADCDDGDACTNDSCADGTCVNDPINCDDGNSCTDDSCDPDTGCAHEDVECPEGHVCEPETGECVEDEDPCECVNGRVAFCHIPPGNPARARTITTNCDALEDHLAHGDHCGPCE